MAVMAVVAILLSLAAVGIQNIDKGQATTTALAVSEAVLDEAREAAVGQGTRARLLIHRHLDDTDKLDRVRYLSYLAVAVLEKSGDGEAVQGNESWRIISRGTQLPPGVYFSEQDTRDAAQRADVGEVGEMTIALPGDQQAKRCYFIEFNAEGVCVDGSGSGDVDQASPGAAMILIGGSRARNNPEPRMRRNNKVGFIIWRNGRTSVFQSATQIDEQ